MDGKFKSLRVISPTRVQDAQNTTVKRTKLRKQNVAAVCVAFGAILVACSVLVTVLVYINPSVNNNTDMLRVLQADVQKLKEQNQETATGLDGEEDNIKNDSGMYRDCQEILTANQSATSGIYTIYPYKANSTESLEVYCDMTTDGGGWIVFQRRQNGTEDFFRDWNGYKEGFGNLNSEFWLGLDAIYKTVSEGDWELLINLKDDQEGEKYALYQTFSIGNEGGGYILTVQNYTGNAGDALSYHNDMQFSTKDRDNDLSSVHHCAVWMYEGAWWYNSCTQCDLNRNYGDLYWNGVSTSVEFTEMKMKLTV